jgi:CPA2 family monovalent cation:H+ antiporter-2
VERISIPLRDVFAAFFFLNFGLSLNIAEFGSVVWVVIDAVALTVVLNALSGWLIARFNRLDARAGINIAAILMNRGEFTLILATLSLAAGLNQKLEPFAGLYVLIMAILGPVLAANSERIGSALFGRTRRRPPVRQRNPVLDEEIALVDAVTGGQQAASGEDSAGKVDESANDEPTREAIDRIVAEAMKQSEPPDRKQN